MAMAHSTRRLSIALFRGAALSRLKLFPPPPSSSILSRGFASAKLFVGGLSFRTEEEGLRNAFGSHGEVTDVRIITDRETGRSKGFGFVTFLSESDAETALSKMDGHILDGRVIRVDRASARPPAPRPAGGFGGFNSAPPQSSGAAAGPGLPSQGPLFDSPSPVVEEDWGAIPSNVAAVPQSVAVPPAAGGLDAAVGSSAEKPSPVTDAASSQSPITSSQSPIESNQSVSDLPAAESKTPDISTTSQTVSSFSVNASSVAVDTPNVSVNASSVSVNSQSSSTTSSFGLSDVGSSSTSGSSSLSSSGFSLSNFPSFDSSSYQDDPPLPKRRPRPRPRPIPQSSVSNFNYGLSSSEPTRSPFGSTSIDIESKPPGEDFDFGLSDVGNTPPPLEPGSRPQGTFDIHIPEYVKEAPPAPPPEPKPLGFSLFPQRTLPSDDLPWDTPEADNWSEIGKDPPKLHLSSLYSPLRSFVSKEKELHWDPYDFDEETKSPEPEVTESTESSEANVA